MRIKLFGLGSAGCNMIERAQVQTVAFSTSAADLERSTSARKILMGPERLLGIATAKGDVLQQIPSIAGHEIVDLWNNVDFSFMMCGLGGFSGSLGAKMFSSIACSKGVPNMLLATAPFSAESSSRRALADRMLDDILHMGSLCVQFDNDELSTLAPNLPMFRAFGLMNGIMLRPMIDICSSMSRPDVEVLRRATNGSNYGRFGLGIGRGDNRAERAVSEALSSPWFDFPLSDTKCAMAIYSASDPWQKEFDEMLRLTEERLPMAQLLCGSYADNSLGDRIRLSLILFRGKS